MEIRAQHRAAPMAPRKIRVYREAIKGLPVMTALAQLQFMPGQGPAILRQVLQSAVANAKHNFDVAAEDLTVADVVIDGGFTLKRFMPVSRGMAHPILKRTSHVTVVVTSKDEPTKPTKRRQTQIEEFTMADVAAGKVGGSVPKETALESKEKRSGLPSVPRSKQEEARSKMNLMQKGGDPKKTHRRKSLGQ